LDQKDNNGCDGDTTIQVIEYGDGKTIQNTTKEKSNLIELVSKCKYTTEDTKAFPFVRNPNSLTCNPYLSRDDAGITNKCEFLCLSLTSISYYTNGNGEYCKQIK